MARGDGVFGAGLAGNDLGAGYFLNADERGGGAVIGGKASFSPTQAGAHLTRVNVSWAGVGSAATVTFAFRATAPATMPQDMAGFSQFNAAQIAATLSALTAWSDVASITFVRVNDGGGYSNNASMLFGNYASGVAGAWAYGYFPGNTSFSSISGDVWFNSTVPGALTPAFLNYNFHLSVHEIGHALGLSHPGTYDVTSGQPISYAANAEYYEDSRQYSVMSYFGASNTGANHGGFYPASPMLDDIVAIQRLYGANMTTRTGDTTYGFNSNAGRQWYSAAAGDSPLIFAVWDAGGRDTFDFSGYAQNQVIDLRQGAFSSVGGLTGNVAIAVGVVIENAIGGSGNDVIRGNDSANVLVGGSGSDTITGGGGIDRAVYGGLYQAYAHTGGFSAMLVGGGPEGGTDSVSGVEQVAFLDGHLSYETDTWQSVVFRMYDAAFDRGPDPFGMKTWAEALASGTNLRVLSDTFEASAEFQTRYGALNNTNFIKEMYRFSLNREADAPGLLHWENLMAGGMSRAEVLFHFSESQEHKNVMTARILAQGMWIQDEKTISIARLYDAILDRVPDIAGLKAFRAQMESGATLTQVALALMQQPEFQSVYGGLGNQAFVEKMYLTILNRAGSAEEINILTGYLNNGTPRVDLLLGLSETIEHALSYQAIWNNQVRKLENGLYSPAAADDGKHPAETLPGQDDDAFAPEVLPGQDDGKGHDKGHAPADDAFAAEVSPAAGFDADDGWNAHILPTADGEVAAKPGLGAETQPLADVRAEVLPALADDAFLAEILPANGGLMIKDAVPVEADVVAFDDPSSEAAASDALAWLRREEFEAPATPEDRHGALDHLAHRSHLPHPDDLFA